MDKPLTEKQKAAFEAFLHKNPQFAGISPEEVINELRRAENLLAAELLFDKGCVKPFKLELGEGCFYIESKPACP